MRNGLCVLLVAVGASVPGPAQEPPVPTLRVFANLIQIPALVLDHDGQPVDERTRPQFTVALDGGKPFAPTHVRLEGDDPLALAVLLDASGPDDELLREMPSALAALVPGGLLPHDRVSVYASDCRHVETLDDAPADTLALKIAVVDALQAPTLHEGKRNGACPRPVPLRDTLIHLTRRLGRLPGRRALLVLTHGADTGSQHKWSHLAEFAKQNSVSIFGISTLPPWALNSGRSELATTPDYSAAFETTCRTTGGLVLTATGQTLTARVAEFTRMLRARYLVQFPRPDKLSAGSHALKLEVPGHEYVILTTGALVPLEDPHLKDDPTVVRGLGKPLSPETVP